MATGPSRSFQGLPQLTLTCGSRAFHATSGVEASDHNNKTCSSTSTVDRYAVYIGPKGPISPKASGSPSLNEVPVQGLLRHQWRRGLRPQHKSYFKSSRDFKILPRRKVGTTSRRVPFSRFREVPGVALRAPRLIICCNTSYLLMQSDFEVMFELSLWYLASTTGHIPRRVYEYHRSPRAPTAQRTSNRFLLELYKRVYY